MVLGTGKMPLGEIANIYPSAQFSSEMIRYLYPSGAMMYTFVSVWVSFSILGLFMYWVREKWFWKNNADENDTRFC